jgi:hypothetical protein
VSFAVQIRRDVVLTIANKYDRLADVLLKPHGMLHLTRILRGACGHGVQGKPHPTPGYIYINAYISLDLDTGMAITFECMIDERGRFHIEGAYPRRMIECSEPEPKP